MRRLLLISIFLLAGAGQTSSAQEVSLGPRPLFLVDNMDPGPLKEELLACASMPAMRSNWSIGHRGAALQFPEHTRESYVAAARMGAGIIECDVTFTKDRQLVCRHAQNDLHTTTNILVSQLASTCIRPFMPATGDDKATAECRTAEITLDQFKSLNGKMDAADNAALAPEGYVGGTANWRTDLYATTGTLLSLNEHIALIDNLGASFTPELKAPAVEMPFEGDYTQEMYAQQMIDAFKAAGIEPSRVYPQSFNLDDVLYWVANEPDFGKQAVFLDGSYSDENWSPMDDSTWQQTMADLKSRGVNYIAPPMWVLVTVENGKLVPSLYAKKAREAGIKIITWTAERSGPLADGGGWYFQTSTDLTNNDGDVFNLLHVLNTEVGISGMFSDWPATTTYYANCFGLE